MRRLLAIALVLVAPVAFVPAAEGAFPGVNGPVVFVGLDPAPPNQVIDYRASGLRSWAPRVAGSLRQLTTDPTDDDPKVSPDGQRVVFSRTIERSPGVRRSGIFVVNIDGSGLTQVTDGGGDGRDFEPTFYPTGERILFVRGGGDTRAGLYSVRLDGGGLRLIASGYAEVRTPAVSPTGRQIVFGCRHFRNGVEYSWEHICSIRPDGSRRRDLTPRFRDGQLATDPEFSPDGRLIAFTIGPGIAADIFTMRANGRRLGALTNRGPRGGRVFPRDLGYDDPAFAPAGGRLIAVARSGERPRFVFVPLRDAAHPRPLEPQILGRSPSWAPIPRAIAAP